MPNECTTVLYIYCTVCCQQDFRNRVELSLQIKNYFNIRLYQSRKPIWLAIERVRILYTYLQFPHIWLQKRKQK